MSIARGFASSKDSANEHSTQPPQLPAIDAESIQAQWQSQFADLDDSRGRQGVEHPFMSMVMLAILAVIGRATSWEDIETYTESHEDWLRPLFSLPNGVIHTDTYRRLFERMAPDALERCFLGLVKQIVERSGAQVILIDGKTIKGSYDRNSKQSTLQVVSFGE
jgi:hypothetical protein